MIVKRTKMRPFFPCYAFIMCFAAWAEERAVTQIADVSELRLGLSRDQVAKGLGDKGVFQFKTKLDGIVHECIAYNFVRHYYGYYFVFREDTLLSINRASDFFATVKIKEHPGDFSSIVKEAPYDTAVRVRAIATSPGKTIDDLISDIQKFEQVENTDKPRNCWPAFVALAPMLIPAAAKDGIRNSARHRKWSNQFNAEKVQLGSSIETIEKSLGKPVFGISEGTTTTLAFGPVKTIYKYNGTIDVDTEYDGIYWIVVRFEKNYVEAVYSDRLFNYLQLVHKENDLGNYRLP